MKKYRTVSNYQQYNEANGIVKGQSFDLETQPSLTRPDQSLSIRELLTRFTRGGEVRVLQPQHLPPEQPGIPDEFATVRNIDWSKMDKLEKLDMKKAVTQEIKQLREKIKLSQEKLREAKEAIDKDKEKNEPGKAPEVE